MILTWSLEEKKIEWYTVWLYNHVYSCWMIAYYYGMFISESKKKSSFWVPCAMLW